MGADTPSAASLICSIAEKDAETRFDIKEANGFFDGYQYEQQLWYTVETGNTVRLERLMLQGSMLPVSHVASNALRQAKNLGIVSISLATRAAIRGGLDTETAYQLSDRYMNKIEECTDINSVNALFPAMLTDFTSRVADSRLPRNLSPDIYRCVQFIRQNTNQPISVEDVANHIGMSRSWTSKKFRAEVGRKLCDYITECRLEEGARLLRFSRKTVNDIACYLCFSSPSYFQNLFKKHYGVTPDRYRKTAAPAI